jgi:hypothetical protein
MISGFHHDVDDICPLLHNKPQERISFSFFDLRPIPSFLHGNCSVDAFSFSLQT